MVLGGAVSGSVGGFVGEVEGLGLGISDGI